MKVYNIRKTILYLKSYFRGRGMWESMKALSYVIQKHGIDPEDPNSQKRDDGQLYLIHPTAMACYALSLEINDDTTIAVILLHDVCEDCSIGIEELPFPEEIQNGVRFMTVPPYTSETKEKVKEEYFRNLLYCRDALICKAIDRYFNLSQMEGVLSEDRIIKNIRETDTLLLPVLKKGTDRYPEDSNKIYALYTNLIFFNETLAVIHKVKTQNYDPELGVLGSVKCILENGKII